MDEAELGQARYRRWRVGRSVRTLDDAAGFLGDVGFALLFPTDRIALPSLWEAVAGDEAVPFADGVMGEDERMVWTWKEQLPLNGHAWYGRFLRGRASFLAPDLVAALYQGSGNPKDHEDRPLSIDAHQLANALAAGPLPSSELRRLIGRGKYERAVTELQRQLLVTTAGVQEQSTGWPSAVIELTCRLFEVGGRYDPDRAAQRFLDTVLDATVADLARAFGWTVAEARAQARDSRLRPTKGEIRRS
jgi:hypothetical protein